MTDESKLSEDDVWQEHLESVHVAAHWAYLAAVILGGLAVMLLLMALLGASGG